MFFIRIISMKRDHENIFIFVSIFFMGDYKYNYFFSMKTDDVNVVGTGKNMWEFYVRFF